MATLAGEERQQFDVPAADVWAYRFDFMNLPAYNPAVHEIELLEPATALDTDGRAQGVDDEEAVGVGARYRFMLDTAVGAHPVTLTVTEAIRDRLVSASMRSSITATETFAVEALPGDRSEVTLSLWLGLPDGLDQKTAAAMLASGRVQIRAELDALAVIFNRH